MTRGEVTSLLDLCMDKSLKLFDAATFKTSGVVFLPEDVCEAFISKRLKSGDCTDNFLSSFSNPQTSRIVRVNLKGASITDRGLQLISCQPIRELNISRCLEVTQHGIKHICQCKNTLKCLNIGQCIRIMDFCDVAKLNNLRFLDLSKTLIEQYDFEIVSEGLQQLQVLNLAETVITDLGPVKNMRHLTSLDLSNCRDIKSIAPLEILNGNLRQLILYNCLGLEDFKKSIDTIVQLDSLQHLDLSKDGRDFGMDVEPPYIDGEMLHSLSQLPKLVFLDISGTAVFEKEDLKVFGPPHPRLHFLGLCLTEVCYYPNIPANVVTGESGEDQIIASLRHYLNRPTFLISAMRELFNLVRSNHNRIETKEVCNLVLNAMTSNMTDHKIQIAGSASLYHLSRDDHSENDEQPTGVTAEQRRQIVTVTLDSMENHIAEEQLQKNCCLTLCNFRIPVEVEFEYKRVARVLLKSATLHRTDFIQRIAIGLCNLLVCQVHDDQKVTVGRDLEGVKMVLQVMRQKLDSERPEVGGVLECCWSALWNVTDETPENCALFMENGGMPLFMECKRRLGHHRDLLRNMLGLMGNVSEVDYLRPQLMAYAEVFYELLDSVNELEVSYNAAGILCHLASDGPTAWTAETMSLSRDQAMRKLIDCVEKWDIGATRQMSYRSFGPILRLIPKYETPAIQHWATWALANLCNVDHIKYCRLIVEEDGLPLLEELYSRPETDHRVRNYCKLVLDHCQSCSEIS
ncbi:protein zer-1 homolog isoform X2 [Nematostella vectensis]|uniref:protein zer-1 homolog isoform X2 n=1 Tax=Nematostella vectensis TaxID=45351 RepID=UPI0020777D30|nr:protein zer-1 homolog isoform X2 [Nematostella vectensis]